MGVMIEGTFHVNDPGPETALDGTFRRQASTIRNRLPDGPLTPGRLHVYVSWSCPWAHRVLLVRAIKGLQDMITVAYARPRRTDQGWVYDAEGPHADPHFGLSALHEAYARVDPAYTGRLTVPLLWDCEADTALNNESADIVRMLNRRFDQGPDLAPEDLLADIDAWNTRIYRDVNNGVYRAGFARTQEAYEQGCRDVFAALDTIDAHLGTHRYLCGDRFTEADLRLFPTLARFDVAYNTAFKCNLKRLTDYAHLWPYAREIYQMPGVAETVRFDICKSGYFSPSELRNPLGIVPLGPIVDWTVPHGRG